MAFAALIDPKKVASHRQHDDDDHFLQPIEITEEETSRIFLGALMVMGMQLTMVSLLITDMFS